MNRRYNCSFSVLCMGLNLESKNVEFKFYSVCFKMENGDLIVFNVQ